VPQVGPLPPLPSSSSPPQPQSPAAARDSTKPPNPARIALMG
jgi:hypothetical protein